MRNQHATALMGTTGLVGGVAAVMASAQPKFDDSNPTEIVAEINKAWNAFMEADKERQTQADAVLDGKMETINGTITELQGKLDTALAAQAKQLAALQNHGGGNDNVDMQAYARDFMLQSAIHNGADRHTMRGLAGQDPDVEALVRYTNAFTAFLIKGCNSAALGDTDLRNDLSLGVDSEGGYLVPPNMTSQFTKRLHEGSPIRQIANVVPVTGDSYEFPTDLNRQPTGGWVAEKQAREATGTADVGMGEIRAHECYAYPQLTQKALEDRMLIDPAAWVSEKAVDEFGLLEGAAAVNGDGTGKPHGYLSYNTNDKQDKDRKWGVLQHVKTGANGAFPTLSGDGDNPNAIIDIICSLKAEYRVGAVWTMNRLTEAAFRKLKDNDGHYFWKPPTLPGQPTLLEGYPVYNFEDMPDLATGSLSAAFGNFKEGYTMLDRLGLSLLVDSYTNKPFVGFYFRRRVGGAVTNFDAIKLLKFAE